MNLKPCPCCGAPARMSAEFENEIGEPAVECSSCNLLSWTVEDWNRRAALQEHLVAALVEKDVEIASLKHELSEMQFSLSGLDMRRQKPIPRRIEGEAK